MLIVVEPCKQKGKRNLPGNRRGTETYPVRETEVERSRNLIKTK